MATTYNSNIVTDGLVLCLDAANPRSYSGAGSTWSDLSGNSNHGTLTNSPTFDAVSKSFNFDPTNSYLTIPNSPSLNTDYITVEYILSDSHSLHAYPIVNKSSEATEGRFWRIGVTSPNTFYFWIEVGSETYYSIVADSAFSSDLYHLFCTYDGSIMKMYINGEQQSQTASVSGVLYGSSGDVEIARNKFYNPDRYASHKSYLFRIYNRALSAEEVHRNYNATRGRYGY